jgi:hypothetical protein
MTIKKQFISYGKENKKYLDGLELLLEIGIY